ncbi:dentin sialophosphoprotein-like [Sitophilus oryzae]|uniref:Dentin sialophosphoprotein-like n=1 Tax=Sitophilus oryzae TaxID=7048 RepID=A0A6J2X1B3_SITOR|nr:dentin sialophosphoprotein-like [Sitophilus oryzae]XP_030744990.1 dentin sialophosphoprotein-like [Sitophilus oryzae]
MNARTAKIFKNLSESRLDSPKQHEQQISKKTNDEYDTQQKNEPGTSNVFASIPNNEEILCPTVLENQLETQPLVEISGNSSRGLTFHSELDSNKSNSSSDNYNPEEDSTSSSFSSSTCSSSSDTSESEDQNEMKKIN